MRKWLLVLSDSTLVNKINLLAIALCAGFVSFWMVFIAKWYYFRYTGGWDTAYFIQSLWGLAKGDFSPSLLDSHFLADHCHFITFLIAPIYWLFPDPLLLQNIKIIAFFAGAFILFLIIKKRIHPWVALGVMVAYCIAPANVAMLRFAFSYEALALPLILLMFKAFDDKKYVLYLISAVLLMMVKEQMPLVVMGFGVFAFMARKEERIRWALVPFLMGLAVFIIEVFVLLPLIRNKMGVSEFVYWNRYLHFGKNPQEIIVFLLSHPGRVWTEFFSGLNLKWYNDLFSVWGGVGFFSPQFLFPAVPLFLKMALSSEQVEHSVIAAYYGSVFTPFLFLSVCNSLSKVAEPFKLRIQLTVLLLMMLHAFHYMPMWFRELQDPVSTNLLATHRFIERIPKDASVLSGRKAMTYLAQRDRLYAIKDYFKGGYYISGKKFSLPADIDYALVDFSEFTDTRMTAKVAAFNFDDRFRLLESIEDVALFVRNTQKRPSLTLVGKSRQPMIQGKSAILGGGLILEGVEIISAPSERQRVLHLRTYWRSLKKMDIPYEIRLRLLQGDRLIYEKRKRIGSTIYPTHVWAKDEYVREDYFYLLPRLSKGQYLLEMEVYDPRSNKSIPCKEIDLCAEGVIVKDIFI